MRWISSTPALASALGDVRARVRRRPALAARLRRLRRPVPPSALRHASPVSRSWGADRGTPLDRHYVDAFLAANRADIRGRVLEVKDDRYTRRFGTDVVRSDVVDIDAANRAATIHADLAAPAGVPDGAFDCIILTQTLQLIYDVHAVAREAHRLLAPRGVLLVTVPAVSRLAGDPEGYPDYWRFTVASGRRLFGDVFGPQQVQVESAGNMLAAVAFLQGLAAEEVGARRLRRHDPMHPVVIAIRAVKER